jgi:hypothetical protein
MGSSTTTRNFGMRRFTNLVRESRFRGLASGTELVLGTMVEVDPSDPTRIRAAVDNAIGGGGDVRTGNCGILWYEQDSQTYNDPRFGGAAGLLPQDLDTAPNGRMVQVLSGAGAKVWFRNTGDSETEPGLNYSNTRAARTMVFGIGGATATTTIGELLGWDNSNKYWTVTTDVTEAYLRITDVDDTYLTVDAVILH